MPAGDAARKRTATPVVQFREVLDRSERDALFRAIDSRAERLPLSRPVPVDTHVDAGADDAVDLGPTWLVLDQLLRNLAGYLRRELGIDHFVLDAIDHRVTVHDGSLVRMDGWAGRAARGTPRIDFVYVLEPPDAVWEGGTLRLYDTVDAEGLDRAADTFTEIELSDNTLVCFPSDRHHDATRLVPTAAGSARRFVIAGSLVGDSLPARPPPSVDVEVLSALQRLYLPTLNETGFEVRPTPRPVHRVLEALLELRAGRRRSECADSRFHRSGSPDLVDISDLGDDILRWLQPIHEEFAGRALVPSMIFGLRVYRPGNSLTLHVDRPATHVISSVIQVSQDVDEPWPLVVEQDGQLHEVFLAPGEMLLYEGATHEHGRPSPLRGRSFVNLFAHYRPHDWPWTVDGLAAQARNDCVIDRVGRLTSRAPRAVARPSTAARL